MAPPMIPRNMPMPKPPEATRSETRESTTAIDPVTSALEGTSNWINPMMKSTPPTIIPTQILLPGNSANGSNSMGPQSTNSPAIMIRIAPQNVRALRQPPQSDH